MESNILAVLIGAALSVVLPYLNAYMRRRGEKAGEKSLATHLREFLAGRWPGRLQWVGIIVLVVATISFVWDLTNEYGPASKLDVFNGVVLSLGWSVVMAARAALHVLEVMQRALTMIGEMANTIGGVVDVIDRHPK